MTRSSLRRGFTPAFQQIQGQRGFTLIEMLVVVAIIGILSSVILTALGPARDKAKDARVVSNVNQVRALAGVLGGDYYDAVPDINGLSDIPSITNPDIKALATDIETHGGELIVRKNAATKSTAYVAYSRLNLLIGDAPDQLTNYYCVDSRGRVVFTTNEAFLTTATECPL